MLSDHNTSLFEQCCVNCSSYQISGQSRLVSLWRASRNIFPRWTDTVRRHPVMLCSSVKETICSGIKSVRTRLRCFDLFQVPNGYQLRSKFAHGIADLVTSTSSLSKSTSLLIAVIVSLCSKYSEDSPSSFEISCNKIVHSYTSRFHAFVYLDELRRRSYETIRDLRFSKSVEIGACEIEGKDG